MGPPRTGAAEAAAAARAGGAQRPADPLRRHALALDAALTCVGIEPLRESAHRAVAALHLAEHNAVEAVRQYGAFRRLVRAELGVEPSARFRAMLPPGSAAGR